MAVEMKTCGAMGMSGAGLALAFLTSFSGGVVAIGWASSAQADPVAYWTFDDPAAYDNRRLLSLPNGNDDAFGPDARGEYGGTVYDATHNGNLLTPFGEGGADGFVQSLDTPGNVARWPGGERINNFSNRNSGTFPTMYSHSQHANPSGFDVENVNYTNFTIEASYKPEDVALTRTIVGREGRNVALLGDVYDPALQPLALQVTDDDRIRFHYVDKSNLTHIVETEPGFVRGYQLGDSDEDIAANVPWYNIAVVNSGDWLFLYVNGEKVDYQSLEESLNTDIELSSAVLRDATSRNNAWTVGRGMYNGDHSDRAYGLIDEVRIMNHAVAYPDLLQNRMPRVEVPEPVGVAALGLFGTICLRRRRG